MKNLKAVGENLNNQCAYNVANNSYLDYKNGSLCYDTYNSAITKGEVIYIIVNRYFKDEYDSINISGNIFNNFKNAGDIANKLGIKDKYAWQAYELEYCLQTNCGCPEDIYKALAVASKHDIISSDFMWNETIQAGTVINYIISAYESYFKSNGFVVNAKLGENAGQSLIETVENTEEPTEQSEETIDSNVVAHIRDVTNLDDLFRIYGDEIKMSDKEKEEAYKIAKDWNFKAADQWMEVAHCSYLNVRTGPSTDYDILKSIPSGTKCHIVAVCKENGWYRIIADNKIVYQCGVYFQDFEGSEKYLMKTGENANDN